MSITVNHVNGAPVANDDSASTSPNTPVTVSVLANDTDPDNDTLTVTSVSLPSHGVAVVNLDDTVDYVPALGYSGPDSFTYTISDGNGGTASATVSVSVNDPPTATAQSVTLNQDTTSTVTLTGTDPDNDPLRFKVTSLPTNGKLYDGTGTGGHLIVAGDLPYALTGTFDTATYQPNAGYSGPDSFQFKANDGQVDSTSAATVSITVNHVNGAPVANDDSASTTPNTPVTVSVLTNDTDPDNDLLTVTGASVPAHGTAVVNGGATVTYTPTTGYSGPDSFTYDVSDGNGGTASATVSIAVTVVNSAPTATAQSVTLNQDTTSTVTLTGTDPDNDPLRFKVTSLPANGKLYDGTGTGGHLIVAGDLPYALTGTFDKATYQPNAGYFGSRLVPVQGQRRSGRLHRRGDGVDHGQPREPRAGGQQRLGRDVAEHAGHGERARQRHRPRQRHADGDRRVHAGPRHHRGQRRRHRHLHPDHGLLRPRLVHLRRERRQRWDRDGHRVHHRQLRQQPADGQRPVGDAQPGHHEHRHPHRHRSRQRPAALQGHVAAGQRQALRRHRHRRPPHRGGRAALRADGHVQQGHLPAQRRLLRPRLVPVQGQRRPGRLHRSGDGVDHGEPRQPPAGGQQRLGLDVAEHAGHGERACQRHRSRQRHADGHRRV